MARPREFNSVGLNLDELKLEELPDQLDNLVTTDVFKLPERKVEQQEDKKKETPVFTHGDGFTIPKAAYAELYGTTPIWGFKQEADASRAGIVVNPRAYQQQFNSLIDKLAAWGRANRIDSAILSNLEKFKENFFHPEYSGKQTNHYFISSKQNLEKIWYLLVKNVNIPTATKVNQFKLLCEKIGFCPSGVYTHIHDTAIELTQDPSIEYVLAVMRKNLTDAYAKAYSSLNRIYEGNEVHVNTALYSYQQNQGWTPLVDITKIREHYGAKFTYIDEFILSNFHQYFERSYSPRAIIECIVRHCESEMNKGKNLIAPADLKENKETGWMPYNQQLISLADKVAKYVHSDANWRLFCDINEETYQIRYSPELLQNKLLKFWKEKNKMFKSSFWHSEKIPMFKDFQFVTLGSPISNLAWIEDAENKIINWDQLPKKYDIKLAEEKPRNKDALYIRSTAEGLEYEILTSDGQLKTSTIPWKELSEDFPKNPREIIHSKERYLPILMEKTLKIGHSQPEKLKLFGAVLASISEPFAFVESKDGSLISKLNEKALKHNLDTLIKMTVKDLKNLITSKEDLAMIFSSLNGDSVYRNAIIELIGDNLSHIITNSQDFSWLLSQLPVSTPFPKNILSGEYIQSFLSTDTEWMDFLNVLPKEKHQIFSNMLKETQYPLLVNLAKRGDYLMLKELFATNPHILKTNPELVHSASRDIFIIEAVNHKDKAFLKYCIEEKEVSSEILDRISNVEAGELFNNLIRVEQFDLANVLLTKKTGCQVDPNTIFNLLKSRQSLPFSLIKYIAEIYPRWVYITYISNYNNLSPLYMASMNKQYDVVNYFLNSPKVINEYRYAVNSRLIEQIQEIAHQFLMDKKYELLEKIIKNFNIKIDAGMLNALLEDKAVSPEIFKTIFTQDINQINTQLPKGSILQCALQNNNDTVVKLLFDTYIPDLDKNQLIQAKNAILEEKASFKGINKFKTLANIFKKFIETKEFKECEVLINNSCIVDILGEMNPKDLGSNLNTLLANKQTQLAIQFLNIVNKNRMMTDYNDAQLVICDSTVEELLNGKHPPELIAKIGMDNYLNSSQKGKLATWLIKNKEYSLANNIIGKNIHSATISFENVRDEKGNNILHHLLMEEKAIDLQLFQNICKSDINLNLENDNGDTPFSLAVQYKQYPIINYLLIEHYKNYNDKKIRPWPQEIQKVLIQIEANDSTCPENIKKSLIDTIFLYYLRSINFKGVAELLNKYPSIDINQTDPISGGYPFHFIPTPLTLFKQLLPTELSMLSKQIGRGNTFLSMAAEIGEFDILNYCFEEPEILKQFNDEQLSRVLNQLILNKQYDLAGKLLEKRVSISLNVSFKEFIDLNRHKYYDYEWQLKSYNVRIPKVLIDEEKLPIVFLKQTFFAIPKEETNYFIDALIQAKRMDSVKELIEDKSVLERLSNEQASFIVYQLLTQKEIALAQKILVSKSCLPPTHIHYENKRKLLVEIGILTKEILTYLTENVSNYALAVYQDYGSPLGQSWSLLTLAAAEKKYHLLKLILSDLNDVKQEQNFKHNASDIGNALHYLVADKQYDLATTILAKYSDASMHRHNILGFLASDTTNESKSYDYLVKNIAPKTLDFANALHGAVKLKNFNFIKIIVHNNLIGIAKKHGRYRNSEFETKEYNALAQAVFDFLLESKQYDLANQFAQQVQGLVINHSNQISAKLIDTLLARKQPPPPFELIKLFFINEKSYVVDDQNDLGNRLERAIFLNQPEIANFIISNKEFLNQYSVEMQAAAFYKMILSKQYEMANRLLDANPIILNIRFADIADILNNFLVEILKDKKALHPLAPLNEAKLLILKICETSPFIDLEGKHVTPLQICCEAKYFAAVEKIINNRACEISRENLLKNYEILLAAHDTPKSLIYLMLLKLAPYLESQDIMGMKGVKTLIDRSIDYLANRRDHEDKGIEFRYNKYSHLQYLIDFKPQLSEKEYPLFVQNHVMTLLKSTQNPDEVVQLIRSLEKKRRHISCFAPSDDFINKGNAWRDNEHDRVSSLWLELIFAAKTRLIELASQPFNNKEGVNDLLSVGGKGADLTKKFATALAIQSTQVTGTKYPKTLKK